MTRNRNRVIMPLETENMGLRYWAQAIVIGRRPKRTLFRLGAFIIPVLLIVLFFNFVIRPVQITGPSMIPTFKDGTINFLNRFAYWGSEPHRGDIVGIRYSKWSFWSTGKHVILVKRIVGLPGELVGFRDGKFMVNGKPLDEPYLRFPSADWESPLKTLGPDEYYVVGDNRSMPFFNHDQGATGRSHIIGKILLQGGS